MPDKPIVNKPEKNLPTKPLTRRELHNATKERVIFIGEEFTKGFNFLNRHPKSVTVFGGARVTELDPNYIAARSLCARISDELKYAVITGGGPGIMEAANRGAFEAGGQSLGLTIELPDFQVQNAYLTKNLAFHYFFSRKVCLAFSAEAYLFFPGGFGTMDEFFEILTLVQTKKIEKVPIILFGCDFWKPLDDLIRKEMLSRGTVDEHDLSLYIITDDEDQVLNIIKNAPVHTGIQFSHRSLKKAGIDIKDSSK